LRKALVFIFIFGYLGAWLHAASFEEGMAYREWAYRSSRMSGHVFVVSEWLPKENCEEELWRQFKTLMAVTLENESGCIRANATRQISHPGSPGKSKYKIVLLQEYVDVDAFNNHCASDYVTNCFKTCVENEETSLVEDWCCRLFSEDE
jgi:quinol monooxygenase YgiN